MAARRASSSIGKPQILSFTFVEPRHFYYLILAGVMLALFVSSRLRDARLGRQWMALREDEDVAEAMGIRLVNTKLLAFAIGAAFSGLAGAIFASRIGSIFPNSFNLLISINVLSLIIVGGLGSLPGVILGAFVLVGLPELLREFSEYRLLFYGVSVDCHHAAASGRSCGRRPFASVSFMPSLAILTKARTSPMYITWPRGEAT